MSLEADLRDLLDRVAAPDLELASRLAEVTRFDPDAEVDGITKGVLTTTDLLRIRGRLDALREAVLELARAVDASQSPSVPPSVEERAQEPGLSDTQPKEEAAFGTEADPTPAN